MPAQKPSRWLGSITALGAFAALVWLERRRSLRREVEPKFEHDTRNLFVASASAAAIQIAERPLVEPLSKLVHRRRWGLLKQLSLPDWCEVFLAVTLMDYTLYVWHVLVHRVPWLWRFHQVHHVDLDLDASTALRFHFGEMVFSVPWRAGQVLLLGVSPRALSIWQKATLASIAFHHSNLRLPINLERRLCRFIVTPRMHGIHHSIVPEETNSNWSSGLTIWDWLHGTLRLNVPQDEITIGVPAYQEPQELTLPKILIMPFRKQRPSWQFLNNGRPQRKPLPAPQDQLLQ